MRKVIEIVGWVLISPLIAFVLWLMVVGIMCQGC